MPTRLGMVGIKPSGVTLTPHILRAAYDYLKLTPPFNRWKLPDSSEVTFRVTRKRREAGSCDISGDTIELSMSDVLNGHSASILTTMAHEMVHVRQHVLGHNLSHGRGFQTMAAQICRKHGFDLLGF